MNIEQFQELTDSLNSLISFQNYLQIEKAQIDALLINKYLTVIERMRCKTLNQSHLRFEEQCISQYFMLGMNFFILDKFWWRSHIYSKLYDIKQSNRIICIQRLSNMSIQHNTLGSANQQEILNFQNQIRYIGKILNQWKIELSIIKEKLQKTDCEDISSYITDYIMPEK